VADLEFKSSQCTNKQNPFLYYTFIGQKWEYLESVSFCRLQLTILNTKTVPSAGFMIASCITVAMHPAAPVNQQKYHNDSHNSQYNNTTKIAILHTSENCTTWYVD